MSTGAENRENPLFKNHLENVINDFEISEDDLISYYSENPNLFLVPEKRSFYEINLSSKNFDYKVFYKKKHLTRSQSHPRLAT